MVCIELAENTKLRDEMNNEGPPDARQMIYDDTIPPTQNVDWEVFADGACGINMRQNQLHPER